MRLGGAPSPQGVATVASPGRRGRALQELNGDPDDSGEGDGQDDHRSGETRFKVGEVGLRGQMIEIGLRSQACLAVARGSGVGFGLLILDTGRLEPLRICERVETQVRVDGSHAATIGRGARGGNRHCRGGLRQAALRRPWRSRHGAAWP